MRDMMPCLMSGGMDAVWSDVEMLNVSSMWSPSVSGLR